MCEQTLWFNTSTKMSMTTIYRLLEECPKWVQQEVYFFQIQCISMSCSCIRRPNWGICCWRPISQAEKSWKTNPPGWTHWRSKKGKPFAGCKYLLIWSLQRKIFCLLQLLERGKEENWGVEFVWVTPGLAFSFFVSHIFLFFCLLFSFSLQASPSFLQPISGHAPLPLHKKKINDPKDSPPSLRWCNKQKSKVGFDWRKKTMTDRELLRQVQLRVPLMTDHFLLLSSFLQFEFNNYQYSIRMFRSAFIQALSLQELWKFGMTHLCWQKWSKLIWWPCFERWNAKKVMCSPWNMRGILGRRACFARWST